MAMAALVIILGVLAIGVLGILWAAAKTPRRSMQEICEDAARDTIRRRLPDVVEHIVREEIKKPQYACFRFVKAIQRHLAQADPTLTDAETFAMAKCVWNNFSRDERVQFGDSRYAWDDEGARELAHAYEIEHWEG